MRRHPLLLIASLTSFALCLSVQAQTPAPAGATTEATKTDDTIKLEPYAVHGFQESLNASLDTKRISLDNVDVITAEDVGKFPDGNIAESLSHIPGVTVDRLFGEGERVSILGTDPNLNRLLLNGEPVSSADWYILDNQSRQFNYLLLSPDVVGQAKVYRTWEPKLLEGSVGGTVDVTTRNPLELKPMVFTGILSDAYNDRSKKNEASESVMFSWRNEAKTFGILVGGEDNREFLRRDGVEALSEQTDNNLGVAGPLPGQPAGPWVTDEVVNTAIFTQLRHHQGGNIDLAFRPTDQLSIELTGLYVKQTMNNVNFSYYIFPGDNWSGLPNITNATVAGGVLGKYTINSAPLVIDAFNRAAEIKTQDYNAKVDYKADNFNVEANLGYTRATGGTQHQFFAENFIFANANLAETGSQASFTVTGVPGFDPTAANVANGVDFGTAGAGNFFGNIASNPETDDEKWAQVDFDFKLDNSGPIKHLLTGARFSDHKAGENGNVVSVPNAGSVSTNLATIGVVGAPSNYLSGLPGITPSMSQHVLLKDYGSVENFISRLSAAGLTGALPGETMLHYFDRQPPQSSAVFTSTPTFAIDEQINAAYVESTFKEGSFSGNFGFRAVDTETKSSSFNLSTPVPTRISKKSAYTNILPAANLVWEVAPDHLIRFGIAQVIARPNTAAEANYVQLFDSTLRGVGGNTDLKPYESTNTDLAYEWYFTKNSVVSADLFYKDISNYIINSTNTEAWTDFSLAGHPLANYAITRPSNGGSAKSEGIALSYQQAFGYGFGIQANYTRLHTVSYSFNGPLPFSSKNQINISPYFENTYGLIRLTYAWRDDYESSSFNGTSSVYTAPYTELDANAQFNITKNISLLVSATNLLDETYRQYFKNANGVKLFADEYKFGRTYKVSLHWAF
ncbi:MAG TPA: TonB-dependent receptor [Opitutaceae bacterium]|nr:TonB-dependent receptor [Opitutaceae bacterium]